MFPTIAEYNKAIGLKGDKAFRTLKNINFIPSRTTPLRIYSFGSGSYAVVFKAKDHFKEYAIRCFISAYEENIDRYRKISDYLKKINASWVTDIELLDNEIQIQNEFYPVVKMDWIEGQLLNDYIGKILLNNLLLSKLQDEFVKVSRSLEKNLVGHGDIQCGNIIIQEDSKGNPKIKLIDYDGMYIPSFKNKENLERGRAEFQHPNRLNQKFDEKIDRFSFWVILTAIEALKYDKTLWLENNVQRGFNTLDNLLFQNVDFLHFGTSELTQRLYQLNKQSLTYYLTALKSFCRSNPNKIATPELFSGDAFTPIEEDSTLSEYEYGSQIKIVTEQPGAIILNASFKKIGVTPLTLERDTYTGKKIIVTDGEKYKNILIEAHHTIIDVHFSEADSTFRVLPIDPPEPTKPKVKDDDPVLPYILVVCAILIVAFIVVIAILPQNRTDNLINTPSSDANNIAIGAAADSAAKAAADTTKKAADYSTAKIDSAAARVDSLIKNEAGSDNNYQIFPSAGFKIKCPCELKVDPSLIQSSEVQDKKRIIGAYACAVAKIENNPEDFAIFRIWIIDESSSYFEVSYKDSSDVENKLFEQVVNNFAANEFVYDYVTYKGVKAIQYSSIQNEIKAKGILFFKNKKRYLLQVSSNYDLTSKFDALKNSFEIL